MAFDFVFVTNTNDFLHTDRFDGEEYSFPPNEAVMIPIDAAEHMLAYGLAEKTDVLVRLGWAMKYDEKSKSFTPDDAGVRKLANFVFSEPEVKPKTALERALEAKSE